MIFFYLIKNKSQLLIKMIKVFKLKIHYSFISSIFLELARIGLDASYTVAIYNTSLQPCMHALSRIQTGAGTLLLKIN